MNVETKSRKIVKPTFEAVFNAQELLRKKFDELVKENRPIKDEKERDVFMAGNQFPQLAFIRTASGDDQAAIPKRFRMIDECSNHEVLLFLFEFHAAEHAKNNLLFLAHGAWGMGHGDSVGNDGDWFFSAPFNKQLLHAFRNGYVAVG